MNFDICKKCCGGSIEEMTFRQEGCRLHLRFAANYSRDLNLVQCEMNLPKIKNKDFYKVYRFRGSQIVITHSNLDGSFAKVTCSDVFHFKKFFEKIEVPEHCRFVVEQTVYNQNKKS